MEGSRCKARLLRRCGSCGSELYKLRNFRERSRLSERICRCIHVFVHQLITPLVYFIIESSIDTINEAVRFVVEPLQDAEKRYVDMEILYVALDELGFFSLHDIYDTILSDADILKQAVAQKRITSS